MNYGALIHAVYERWSNLIIDPAYPHGLVVTSSQCTEENDSYVAAIALGTRPTATDLRVTMSASIPYETRDANPLCCVRVSVAKSVVWRTVTGTHPPASVSSDHRRLFVERMVGHTAALVMGVPFEKPSFGMDGSQLFLLWHGEQLAALTLYFTSVPHNDKMYQATGLWVPSTTGRPGSLMAHTDAVAGLTMEDFL